MTLKVRHASDGGLREDAGVSDFRLVVLASGSGTNLQAILDRLHGREGTKVVGVGSGRGGAGRSVRDAAMGDWIEARGADLVVLAGYMQLLSGDFVARFRHRIVNIHPALLPDFPGLDAIGQALDAGIEVTGVTVRLD